MNRIIMTTTEDNKYTQPKIRVVTLVPALLCSSGQSFSRSYGNSDVFDTNDLGDFDE